MITISAFKWVPPFAQGLVRDLRVRWALEEAGLPYQTRLIDPDVQGSSEYRSLQPFGQVPVFQEDGLTLFESGAIVLHIASRSEVLLPADAAGRARAMTWVFAALNSMEIYIQQLAEIDLFNADQQWAQLHRPDVEKAVQRRLQELAACLGDREYLEGRFTVGDLMMTTVLRNLRHTRLINAVPTLKAYQERCEARPAFQRALAAQMEPFRQR
ncbi:glutathione S-transferase family protein [Corallococcus sicarius]|uniref:Glutathione S-transferase family protein n=1 Tax=Corallococcus sicarius TaxID=2316726 RepID=A0A3A8NBV7_9BACT|nr:glutathione S-transferase family protein [Corallococcus sicarius]RKH41786.1 glutathione S-transferase family protein [Corallococcus sicarius]